MFKKTLYSLLLSLVLVCNVYADIDWTVVGQEYGYQGDSNNCVPATIYNILNITNVETKSSYSIENIREDILKINNKTDDGKGFALPQYVKYFNVNKMDYKLVYPITEEELVALLDEGNILTFLTDMYYMPPEHYGYNETVFDKESYHCFLIVGYFHTWDNKIKFHVLDSAFDFANYNVPFDSLYKARAKRNDGAIAKSICVPLSEETKNEIAFLQIKEKLIALQSKLSNKNK